MIDTLRTSIATPDGPIELQTTVTEHGPLEDFEFPDGAFSPLFRAVTHRGDRTTWPHLPTEPQGNKVPAGCTAATYIRILEVVCSPRLLDDGPCCARVNGQWVTPDHELLEGDDIVITRYVPGRREVRSGEPG